MHDLNDAAKSNVYVKRYHKEITKRIIYENIELYLILAPVIIIIFLFSYIPLYGIVIAFQDYTPGTPFLSISAKWVGQYLLICNKCYCSTVI